MVSMKLVVGTRGSRLSLIQTDCVVRNIKEKFPDLSIKTKVIETIGDKMSDKPLLSIKEKGIFEKNIDRAIIKGEIDFAVHSMKDVPTIRQFETAIVAVPERKSPYDVLVTHDELGLNELPTGSIIGTGSPRRKAQLNHLRPDLKVKSIRGNIDTRVKKLLQGQYDAIILAEVGLQRLNFEGRLFKRLSLKDFTPSPGQGALAVVARSDRDDIMGFLKSINHVPSMIETQCERVFTKDVGGGCKVPIGAIARVNDGILSLYTSLHSLDGRIKVDASDIGDMNTPEELGKKVAKKIRRAGGEALLSKMGRY